MWLSLLSCPEICFPKKKRGLLGHRAESEPPGFLCSTEQTQDQMNTHEVCSNSNTLWTLLIKTAVSLSDGWHMPIKKAHLEIHTHFQWCLTLPKPTAGFKTMAASSSGLTVLSLYLDAHTPLQQMKSSFDWIKPDYVGEWYLKSV